MNSAERERIHLLNVNTFFKKFIGVLSKKAIEVRATPPEMVNPEQVSEDLDTGIKALIAGYPGGLKQLGLDMHIYSQVVSQARNTLMNAMLEHMLESLEEQAKLETTHPTGKAKEISDMLDSLLGMKQ